MADLIAAFGGGTVFIILLIAIPAIIKCIEWCKKIWAVREKFKQENINRGKELELAEITQENKEQEQESRIKVLETSIEKLTTIIEIQQQQLDLLIRSDELDIKSWIKMQHEKWIVHQCIDSQTLDLLEQRYAIYQEEGGNSWAKKLVDELRALPTVTVLPVAEMHDSKE